MSLPTDVMVMQEIEFIGSLGMQPTRYDEIFRMVAHDRLDPSAVVSETVALEDVSEKLEAMSEYDTVGIPVIDSFRATAARSRSDGAAGPGRVRDSTASPPWRVTGRERPSRCSRGSR